MIQVEIGSMSIKTAEHKARALVAERRLIDHIATTDGPGSWKNELGLRLVSLHTSIYTLDIHGERNWNIRTSDLSRLWSGIVQSLDACGVPCESSLIVNLLAYQEVELQLRNGRLPVDQPLFECYKLKTADVSLSREVIKATCGSTPADGLWTYFDIVSELCDDIRDRREDRGTYNLNRFELECSTRGSVTAGLRYNALLDEIIRRHSAEVTSGRDLESCDVNERIRRKVLEARRLIWSSMKDFTSDPDLDQIVAVLFGSSNQSAAPLRTPLSAAWA